MKKGITALSALALLLTMTACGGNAASTSSPVSTEAASFGEPPASVQVSTQATTQAPNEPIAEASATSEGSVDDTAPEKGSKILIAYFTYGENAELPEGIDASASASIQPWNDTITGNTGVVAHMIADAVGGELFSIRTVEPYPDNYDDTIDVGQAEKNDGVYPELASHIENLDSYDTVFLGFPNWWYGMPMVMYSFLEEYDLSGKTIVPFVTFGGSGFSDAISEIQNAEPNATILEGLSLGAAESANAEAEIISWLQDLGYVG
ncbi:MAG: flavodoxin [Oscillospiraceae bacterium]|nr:flavodoxin [Oscillospiraceae bacterium]